MKKLIAVFAAFAVVILIIGIVSYYGINNKTPQQDTAHYSVQLNEIQQLYKMGENQKAELKAEELKNAFTSAQTISDKNEYPLIMSGICILFLGSVSVYCYLVIIRPFHKLTDFADRIANGDFDTALDYERTDYFGKFTWAFDNMRREIKNARACETEAIENHKTVIASLSHDIKTPIASIRAYAEGLEAGMDTTPEKRAKYIGVIIRKCDEVSKLTEDILLHSLSELDRLKITPEKFEICGFVRAFISDMMSGKEDIHFAEPAFSAEVSADMNRTAQLLENLINNARKYAKTDIDITLTQDAHFVCIHVRDYGSGIPDEDMPFITDKFYRGHNVGREQGAGLGLYISKYIATQSRGDLQLNNLDNGLEAVISLPRFGSPELSGS